MFDFKIHLLLGLRKLKSTDLNDIHIQITNYRIVGFFEVLKFRESRGFDRFMKFKPLKN